MLQRLLKNNIQTDVMFSQQKKDQDEWKRSYLCLVSHEKVIQKFPCKNIIKLYGVYGVNRRIYQKLKKTSWMLLEN